MRVFVTGASGHVASAVIPDLLEHGHHVTGLARSDAAAAAVLARGAAVHRATVDDLSALRDQAAVADGVIHLAFKHELLRSGEYDKASSADLAAIEAMASGLEGSGKPFVTTGGTFLLSYAGIDGRHLTEDDSVDAGPRVHAENLVASMGDRGIRSSVIRLSPLVHSNLDRHGFGPRLIAMAREHGSAAYVEDGQNRWPAIHTRDAATLYRLALEQAPAGSRLHGVAEEAITFKEIAETIARNLCLPAVSVTREEASERLGFLATFASYDDPVSNRITREVLGWEPVHPGWVQDMDAGHYFADCS